MILTVLLLGLIIKKVNTRAKKLAQALLKLGAQKSDTIATMAWSNRKAL